MVGYYHVRRQLDLKQRELDLKERELTGKHTRWLADPSKPRRYWSRSAAIGSIVQGILSQHLERDGFRTSLILKAFETADRKQASDNLLRLFEWHLIDDPDAIWFRDGFVYLIEFGLCAGKCAFFSARRSCCSMAPVLRRHIRRATVGEGSAAYQEYSAYEPGALQK